MRYKVPLREAAGRFQARTPFCCNDTLEGYRGAPSSTGMLPNEWVRYVRQFGRHIVYTAMSYQTPVAWVMDDGRVIVPPVSYSQTTGRHMRALDQRWSEPVEDQAVAA